MDRLDRISIFAVAVLVAGSAGIMAVHQREPKPDHAAVQQKNGVLEDPAAAAELQKAGALAKTFFEGGSLVPAESLIRSLIEKYPYQGEPHMLMGDLLMRRQEPRKAVHEYKQAIELNPDYLDKKTAMFQGKKLKNAVGEALSEIEVRLKSSPDDAGLRSEKKTIYYLYRKIAGSCG